jgi:hypothetical protein
MIEVTHFNKGNASQIHVAHHGTIEIENVPGGFIVTETLVVPVAPPPPKKTRTETRGRKKKDTGTPQAAPDLSGQTGTMFTPPITPRLRETE